MKLTRLGVLVPSLNVVVEDDLRALLPAGVVAHIGRVRLQGTAPEQLRGMLSELPLAASLLADAPIDAVGFACTTGSMIGGPGYDRRLATIVETQTRRSATTTISATLEALEILGARTIGLCTPYEPWLTALEADFFRAQGYQVVAAESLEASAVPMHETGAEAIVALVDRAAVRDADVIFVSCANFPSAVLVPALEARCNRPVLTSNQTIVSKLLRMVGVTAPQERLGTLHARALSADPAFTAR